MRAGYRRCSIPTERLIPPSFLPCQRRLSLSGLARGALVIRNCTQNSEPIFTRIESNILSSEERISDACQLRTLLEERQPRYDRSVSKLLRLRDDPNVRLRRLPALRITPLRLLVGDRTGDNHFFAWFPVNWGSHLVLRGQLQRVNHSQHLIKVAAACHRRGKHELDFLIWPDDVNVAHGGVIARLARFGIACGIGWEHPVLLGNLEISVADDWVVRRVPLCFLDVLRPALMIAGRIDRQSHDLHVSAVELWLNFGHIAEFGRADRGEVLGVREQDGPRIADPVMKAHPPLSGFRLEVCCCIANFHLFFLLLFLFGHDLLKFRTESQYRCGGAPFFKKPENNLFTTRSVRRTC